MTEQEAKQKAKEIIDEWWNGYEHMGRPSLEERIFTALLEAAKAPEPPKPVKTRGEEVAEEMVEASGDWDLDVLSPGGKGVFRFSRGVVFDAKDAERWLRMWIAAAIDRERADVLERCVKALDGCGFYLALSAGTRDRLAAAIREAVQP